MSANNPRDAELLAGMAAGAEEAFTELYRRHHASIYRFALHASGSPEAAEDVTHEVFLSMIGDAGRYDAARGPLLPYLYGIARNMLAVHRRRGARTVPLTPQGADPRAAADTLEDLTRAESNSSVRNAVLSLPTIYREVVVLCDLQELDYADAAAALGCAVGTVRSRLHRARSLLAAKLSRTKATASEGGLRPARCIV